MLLPADANRAQRSGHPAAAVVSRNRSTTTPAIARSHLKQSARIHLQKTAVHRGVRQFFSDLPQVVVQNYSSASRRLPRSPNR
jgi:hypothetical protein